jgi:glucose/arabinose dehydrogenase/PKD repeat protein
MRSHGRSAGVVVAFAVAALGLPGCFGSPGPPGPGSPAELARFQDTVVFQGLTNPTVVQFSPDGRVFVGEKSGIVKVFDNLADTTPTTFADLRTKVHNYWDRGLEGLALDPSFPSEPYVYVLYTHDAAIGGTAPRWGSPGETFDGCPTPPGPTTDGCVVSGRLSRLQASGNQMVGSEQVLVEGWCQQFPGHSVGTVAFGSDGALYAGGGDGASFVYADWGQAGSPPNPCGDPPGGVGGSQTPPTAEGGALRAQDLRTAGDPVGLNGSIIRVNPDTGAALPDNPLATNPDLNARRIVAYGLRNPFRFTVRPGTNELWAGDVGWGLFEEIDRIPSPTDATVENFGWPCHEGPVRQPSYDAANLNVCENLYAAPGAAAAPYFSYGLSDAVVPGEPCPTGFGAVSGLAFYNGGSYPPGYQGALFFTDYGRNCIWVLFPGANGLPDPNSRVTFRTDAATPVDLKIGPGGDLFYVDFFGGTVRRITYSPNRPPTAVLGASAIDGPVPTTIDFDASGSSDPDAAETLSYAWDLDGDGAFDDSTALAPSYTYTAAGVYTVKLQVTDLRGASDIATQVITIGVDYPRAIIDSPAPTLRWKVGDQITFSGRGTDVQDGTIPASGMSWSLIMHHCSTPEVCHQHLIQNYPGVAGGSFAAPDHEYPSYLELKLTVTDSSGLRNVASVRLDPQTVALTFLSNPSGVTLGLGSGSGVTPFTRTVIVGSTTSVSAPSPVQQAGIRYVFDSWSDGLAASHLITAGASPATYTARYRALPNQAPVANAGPDATVGVDTPIFLDGNGSFDPEGGPLTYLWELVSGGPTGILSPTSASAVAGGLPSPGTVTFRLTVTDLPGLSASDTVTVTVV